MEHRRRNRRARERPNDLLRKEAWHQAAALAEASGKAHLVATAKAHRGAQQAISAVAAAQAAALQAKGAEQAMLEEYDDVSFRWGKAALDAASSVRTTRIDELDASESVGMANRSELQERARLHRNVNCAEALKRFLEAAPLVDGNHRHGQCLLYRRGGVAAGGHGRRYPIATSYVSQGGKRRTATLQGCPREVRLLLCHLLYHDIDFVNSLPTVACQLDTLGLCSPNSLKALRDYCNLRQEWFDEIIAYHSIPPNTGLDTCARDVAKALPLRLLHGGTYIGWALEFGLGPEGIARQEGLPRVHALERQLATARAHTVRAYAMRDPAWVHAQRGLALAKKAKKYPRATPTELWQKATASVFAIIIQDIEDRCLSHAQAALDSHGWVSHSLQQDGVLVEEGRRPDGSPATPLTTPEGTGALWRAERAITQGEGISMKLLEKPFFAYADADKPYQTYPCMQQQVEDVVARLALPATAPPRRPLPLNVSGRPFRSTAREAVRLAGSRAAATTRRAERQQDDADCAAADAAEACEAASDAAMVAALCQVEATRGLGAATTRQPPASVGSSPDAESSTQQHRCTQHTQHTQQHTADSAHISTVAHTTDDNRPSSVSLDATGDNRTHDRREGDAAGADKRPAAEMEGSRTAEAEAEAEGEAGEAGGSGGGGDGSNRSGDGGSGGGGDREHGSGGVPNGTPGGSIQGGDTPSGDDALGSSGAHGGGTGDAGGGDGSGGAGGTGGAPAKKKARRGKRAGQAAKEPGNQRVERCSQPPAT